MPVKPSVSAHEDAGALDVADEVDAPLFRGLLQKREGLVLELAALGILGADVQKADAGALAAHHLFGVEATHIGKLQEVFGGTFHIRAAVDKHDAVLTSGQNRSHRRAADALNALDDQRRAGQQRAGGARGNNRVALSVAQVYAG